MKIKFSCNFIICLFIIYFLSVSGVYADGSNIIKLKSFDLENIEYYTSSELDNLLYPTIKNLPTRYIDFLDYIPYTDIDCDKNVSLYLNEMYPEALGEFTYPEYIAAKRFLYFRNLNYLYGNKNSIVKSLHKINEYYNINMLDLTYELNIGDSNKFRDVLVAVKDFLIGISLTDDLNAKDVSYNLILLDNGKGFTLSGGYNINLNEFNKYSDYSNLSYDKYSEYLLHLNNYINFFDFEIKTSNNMLFDEKLTRYFWYTEEVFKNNETLKEDDLIVNKVLPEIKSIYIDASNNNKKLFGFKDVFDIAGFIFVVIALLIFWLIDFIKNRKDPLRRWLK